MLNNENNVIMENGKSLEWNTGDIFEANLMFPTKHFEDQKQLENLTDEEFSGKMIGLLEPCQPLSNKEQQILVSSIKTGNRLRVYYHVMAVINRHIEVVNEVQDTPELEDYQLGEGFGLHTNNKKVTILRSNKLSPTDKELLETE